MCGPICQVSDAGSRQEFWFGRVVGTGTRNLGWPGCGDGALAVGRGRAHKGRAHKGAWCFAKPRRQRLGESQPLRLELARARGPFSSGLQKIQAKQGADSSK